MIKIISIWKNTKICDERDIATKTGEMKKRKQQRRVYYLFIHVTITKFTSPQPPPILRRTVILTTIPSKVLILVTITSIENDSLICRKTNNEKEQ